MDNPTVERIKLNEYALFLRDAGKTYREIGEVLGVSLERARQRVARGRRETLSVERDKDAEIMGYLLGSTRLTNGIKNMEWVLGRIKPRYVDMRNWTFSQFLDRTSLRQFRSLYNTGRATSDELISILRVKGADPEKIEAWIQRGTD